MHSFRYVKLILGPSYTILALGILRIHFPPQIFHQELYTKNVHQTFPQKITTQIFPLETFYHSNEQFVQFTWPIFVKHLKLISCVFCPASIGRSSVVLGESAPPTWMSFYLHGRLTRVRLLGYLSALFDYCSLVFFDGRSIETVTVILCFVTKRRPVGIFAVLWYHLQIAKSGVHRATGEISKCVCFLQYGDYLTSWPAF